LVHISTSSETKKKALANERAHHFFVTIIDLQATNSR
jgi:hypothetical protein